MKISIIIIMMVLVCSISVLGVDYVTVSNSCTTYTCTNVNQDGEIIHINLNDSFLIGYNFEGGVKDWTDQGFDGTWSGSEFNTSSLGSLGARIDGTYEIAIDPIVSASGSRHTLFIRSGLEDASNSQQLLLDTDETEGLMEHLIKPSQSELWNRHGNGTSSVDEGASTISLSSGNEFCSGFVYDGTTDCFHTQHLVGNSINTYSESCSSVPLQWNDANPDQTIGGRTDSHPDRAFYGYVDSLIVFDGVLNSTHMSNWCGDKYPGFYQSNGTININFSGLGNTDTINVSYVTSNNLAATDVCFIVDKESGTPTHCTNTTSITLTGNEDVVNLTFTLNTTNDRETPLLYNVTVEPYNATAAEGDSTTWKINLTNDETSDTGTYNLTMIWVNTTNGATNKTYPKDTFTIAAADNSCDLSSTCGPVDCSEGCEITSSGTCSDSDTLIFENDGVITLSTLIDVDNAFIKGTCAFAGTGGIV